MSREARAVANEETSSRKVGGLISFFKKERVTALLGAQYTNRGAIVPSVVKER